MSYLMSALRVELGRKLRAPGTWILLLLLAALTAAVHAVPEEERAAPVRVGVDLPEEGAQALWERLQARGGTVVTFLPATEEEIDRRVSTGQWDCGLVLPEDFSRRLADLDIDGLVTLRTGPGSTVYPLVRETVFACLAELLAQEIGADYLLDSGIAGEGTLPAMERRLAQLLPEEERVGLTLSTTDGRPLDALALAEDGTARLLRGIVAILLLLWMIFSAMDMGTWLESPAAGRFRAVRGTTALLLPRVLAAALLALLTGGAVLCLLPGGAAQLLALAPYVALLGAMAVLLARFTVLWTALPVLMPFVPVLCLLLSPILVDITLFVPQLSWLASCSPVTLCLRAGEGSWLSVLLLSAAAAGLMLLSLLLDRREKSFGRAYTRIH